MIIEYYFLPQTHTAYKFFMFLCIRTYMLMCKICFCRKGCKDIQNLYDGFNFFALVCFPVVCLYQSVRIVRPNTCQATDRVPYTSILNFVV